MKPNERIKEIFNSLCNAENPKDQIDLLFHTCEAIMLYLDEQADKGGGQ